MGTGSVMLLVLTAPVALALTVFVAQILLASAGRRHGDDAGAPRERGAAPAAPPVRIAVVIPAHDEERGIARTLASIRPQLHDGDRLLVVADNCADATAQVARDHGAAVVERHHASQRGKGFALAFGIDALRDDPPGLVIFVDADCDVAAGAIAALAHATTRSGRPAQARYLMLHPAGASLPRRLAQFAWRVRNWARPAGWHRIGAPCQLMGSGMCFRWETLRDAPLANGSLVEDMQLGIDLAHRGLPPVFCPEALVTSAFPASDTASRTQRTRWEHGHLEVIVRSALPLLGRGVSGGDARLVLMALDLLVPPLALLAASLACLLLLSMALAWLTHSTALAWTEGTLTLLFAGAVLQARRAYGQDLVSLAELATVPAYIARKLPMYARFLTKRQQRWVRTERDGS